MRAGAVIILGIAAGAVGYSIHQNAGAESTPNIPAETIVAPAANSVRVIYSLDAKQNDQEIIALINAAKSHIYFAMYEFTLKDIADALVAAKKRGVDVRGLVDSTESASSYDAPIIAELTNAGIPIETEKQSRRQWHHAHQGNRHRFSVRDW